MDLSASVATAIRTGAMQALGGQIDLAGPGATLALYASARPAPNGAPGAAAIVTVTLAYPCGTASDGALNLADTEFAQILNGGAAVWARLADGAGTWVADLSVGTPEMHASDPATAEVVIAVTTLYTGAFLALSEARIVGN
jgi:hypothetical protein